MGLWRWRSLILGCPVGVVTRTNKSPRGRGRFAPARDDRDIAAVFGERDGYVTEHSARPADVAAAGFRELLCAKISPFRFRRVGTYQFGLSR